MKKVSLLLVGILLLGSVASAVNLEMVPVGNPGNAVDVHQGWGGVGYGYQIGKYEVTNDQYCEFLNAVADTDTYNLYKPDMTSSPWGGILRQGNPGSYSYTAKPGRENHPVTWVNWFDTLRFANWLQNGQPVGMQNHNTTEAGTYTFADAITVTVPDHTTLLDGHWVLTSENEWYKAAYYKGGSTNAGYWDYATQSDTLPAMVAPPGDNNSANASWMPVATGTSPVGAYINAPSAYDTFDQCGNVMEWTETQPDLRFSQWVLRGGSYDYYEGGMASWYQTWNDAAYPYTGAHNFGFRVAYVPEPMMLSLLALGGLVMTRKRKQQ